MSTSTALLTLSDGTLGIAAVFLLFDFVCTLSSAGIRDQSECKLVIGDGIMDWIEQWLTRWGGLKLEISFEWGTRISISLILY